MHQILLIAMFALLPQTGRRIRLPADPPQEAGVERRAFQLSIQRTLSIADLTESAGLAEQLRILGETDEDKASAALQVYLRRRKTVRATANALLQAVLKHAEPPFGEGNDVRLDGVASLIVTATPEHAAWVSKFLDMQRGDRSLVTMKALTCTLPLDEALKLKLNGTSEVLNNAELSAFRKKLEAHPELTLVSRPSVSVHVANPGVVQTNRQVAYISDYAITRVFPGEHEVADPIIKTLTEGTRWRFLPLQLGADTYSLALSFKQSGIEEMREYETTLGGSVSFPVTITLPELSIQEFQTQLALDIGQGLVVRIPNSRSETATFLVLELTGVEDGSKQGSPF